MRSLLHRAAVLATTIAVAVLAGCALNRPPTTGELQQQALPYTNVPYVWKAAGGAPDPVGDYWLSTFDDSALSALVDEAQAGDNRTTAGPAASRCASACAASSADCRSPQRL